MIAMRCLLGSFAWSLELDGECPNHGFTGRYGHERTVGAFCGDDGPEDGEGTPILGCCSVPESL